MRTVVFSVVAALAAVGVRGQMVWTQVVAPASPPFGVGAFAFDGLSRRVLCFGGDPFQGFGGTWAWDGNVWAQLTPPSQPQPRCGHAMVWDRARQRIVLFGGEEPGPQRLNDTWEWAESTWQLRSTAVRPGTRSGGAMAYDTRRARTVLFGGFDGGPGWLNDTWEWDGARWQRRISSASPPGLPVVGMAYDEARGVSIALLLGADIEHWEWDGTDWTERQPLLLPSGFASMVWDAGRGAVVAMDGPSLWLWDGRNWLGQATSNGPAVLSSGGGVAHDPDRNRIVVGIDRTWELSGTIWSQRLPARPTPRRGAVAPDPAGGVAVLFDGVGTWRFDGVAWTDLGLLQSPSPRVEFAMAFDERRRRVVLYGGRNLGGPLGDTWEFDGVAWSLRQPTSSPPPANAHAMVYDPSRGRVVLVRDAGFGSLDAWEWDGTSWLAPHPVAAPPSRAFAALAFDGMTQRVLLFGGHDGMSVLADTWAWDGVRWTLLAPAQAPGPRAAHGMAWDECRRRVVLAGGYDIGAIPPGATRLEWWDWDGSNWAPRAVALRPANLEGAMASLIYDKARGRVVGFSEALGTFDYGTTFPASFAVFGSGCAGSAGIPQLTASGEGRPWLGAVFSFDLRPLPNALAAQPFLLLGASRTTWLGLVLPLPLQMLGLPGCSLLTAADALVPLINVQGAAMWSVALPNQLGFAAVSLYAQGLVTDIAANPGGAVLSNAAELVLGAR